MRNGARRRRSRDAGMPCHLRRPRIPAPPLRPPKFPPAQPTFRQLNWQTDTLPQQFDLILGADIVYERSQWTFLNAFWNKHLTDNGSVLLTEPYRRSGDLFAAWIAEQGWDLEQLPDSVLLDKKIRIFRLMKIK